LILQNICSSANKKDKIGLRNSLFYNICSWKWLFLHRSDYLSLREHIFFTIQWFHW
jgi:hypothetical protein